METIKEYSGAFMPPRVLESLGKLKASAVDATSESVTHVIRIFFQKHYNIDNSGIQYRAKELVAKYLSQEATRAAAVNVLTKCLDKLAVPFTNIAGSESQAKAALKLLKWVSLLLQYAEVTETTVTILSCLLAAVPDASGLSQWRGKARDIVFKLFTLSPALPLKLFECILRLQLTSFRLSCLVLLADLVSYFKKEGSEVSDYVKVIQLFCSVVLGSTSPVDLFIVISSADLFRSVTRSIFKDYLLPAIRKAILRNPDEQIPLVTVVISAVPIDLSPFAIDVLEKCVSYLSSQRPETRDATQELVCALCKQCSDASAVTKILRLVQTALKSSPSGKLTVAEHRTNVLRAMESLSVCPLSSSGQHEVALVATGMLISHIKQEVHGGTALTAANALKAWCALLPHDAKETIDFLKAGLSSKTITPPLRAAYLWCVLALCKEERHAPLLPLPLQSLDRLLATPSPQVPLLEEALVAIHVLIKVSFPDPVPAQVWSVADSHSEHLVSKKLTSAASQESLRALVHIARALLCEEKCKLKDAKQKEWLRGVACVALQSPWETRQVATKCISEVVEARPELAGWLLDHLTQVTEKEEFAPKPMLVTLLSLATPTHPEKTTLAVSSLLVTHHPAIVEADSGVWGGMLKQLDLRPEALTSSSQQLLAVVVGGMSDKSRASVLAFRTLLSVQSEAVVPLLVQEVCQLLGNQQVLTVSEKDMEVLHTPEGELWHVGMRKELEAAVAGTPVSTANMKRESKAYSYEDQKWEVEMRQEMLRKKRAELDQEERVDVKELLKKAKLSQKQRQAMETQLADEEATRARLSQLSERLDQLVQLLEVLRGDLVLPHVAQLSSATRRAISSPLACDCCKRVWRLLTSCVFRDWTLAQLFSVTSICTLTSGGMHPSLQRVFALLKDHSPMTFDLNCAGHTLMLPLLEHVLGSRDLSHDLKESAVLVLSRGVGNFVTAVKEADTGVTMDLQLFPAFDVLKLLSTVIAVEDDSIKVTKLKKQCAALFISLLPPVSQQPQAPPIIISALLHRSPQLRNTVLQALTSCPLFTSRQPDLLVGLLIAQHSQEEENRALAAKLCEANSLTTDLSSDLSGLLIQHCSGDNLVLQPSAALALGVWLEQHPGQLPATLDTLTATYSAKRTTPPPKKDSFGRDIFIEYRDPWECRVGVARALEQLSKRADSGEAMRLLKFVIPGTLSDPSPRAQGAVMAAAQAAISCHGDQLAGALMGHAEECLRGIPDSQEADVVRQSIIVLMGTLAKHMDKENPKVKSVVHLLLSNLNTPSQQVQEAIAACLPPLASVVKPDAEDIIKKLLDKLLESTGYSQRKGAAYGLAGLVKGLGIPTLKHYHVMATLQEAVKNKKNYRYREGALFAFQCLCNMLGRLFEPYVVHLLPDLLVCFGDGNQYVREATDQTARTIMAHLSSHGVKLILPSLLSALEEDSWRTKAGSAELLGAMAFCAPKQLSSCLPSIMPKLMEVLADSHSKVQAAGSQALRQIGSVIKNPEIQVLVPVLLEGLSDPSNKAQLCLQALLETEFVHVIDPPSLALIMPTLKRTLEVRSTDTKKMAAQIIGNMYSLTDKKDLAPYLPDVLPGLKQSLVDPVPEVRTVCAKALGAMAQGMGREGLTELLPWLTATLQSDGTSVDRSGAAQGLSEVLFSQGVEHLRELMPQFVAGSQDQGKPPHSRDGYLMLFVYLPVTFGEQMCGFIGDILPPILKGLADESEFVRETALQAGQTVVNRYADTAVELFLPQLEKGLFDDNWRIRCSSIQLLGDLLYKISGLSGKMSTESEEDDNFGTEAAHQLLLKSLGKERRDRVFAGLYMGRSDVALIVRQTSLHVWKVVVTNTARTLREILPTLVHLLLSCLASPSPDKRKVAARTLGDLVRKLGERVLPEVIPMLEEGLGSDSMRERQGVCVGLSEIIQQTSRDNVLQYMESLLPTVRSALSDQQVEVRAAAAMTFDSLHTTVGPRVLDEVLSPLLSTLSSSSEHSEVALDGLRQVMAVKSRVVLPHIVPQLIQPPVNIRALALLTSVAGEALNKHLNRIIPALIGALEQSQQEGAWQSAEEVILSVTKEPGPAFLIEELVKSSESSRPEVRAVAMQLLQVLCSKSSADLTEHIPHLLIFTTESLNDPSEEVCVAAWLGLEAVVKRVKQKELPHYTGYLRKGLRTVSSNLMGEELRGFALKGITPALTLLKEGLISGSPDEKEEAARVLVEVIHLSSPRTLSSGKVVMLIAGPLIRVLGDRYGWSVKVATLEALVELVRKVGVAAKAFIPQLQTSYLKALNDPNKPVRVQAVIGLTELLPLSPRVDPVFNDVHNSVKKSEDAGLRLTMLQALHGIIKVGGQRMSEKHREEILSTLITLQGTAVESHRLEAAQCVGSLCAYLSDTQLHNTLATHVLDQQDVSDWAVLQARAATISAALLVASSRIVALGLRKVLTRCVVSLASSDRVPVCESGLKSLCSFLNHVEGDGGEMIEPLCQGLRHSALDVKIAACNVCGELLSPSDKVLTNVLPLLLHSYREKNTALKAAAEGGIYKLIQGNAHMKYVCGLLESPSSRQLEETYLRIQAKQH